MTKVFVTGIGLVSALGNSLPASWQNLISGKSGIKQHQPFPEIQPLPMGLIGTQPAKLEDITGLAVVSALQDANLLSPLKECAVVIGSSRGFQTYWEEMARSFYNSRNTKENYPPLSCWLNTLPHMNAVAVARQIGATGIVLAPMAACATGIWTLVQAAMLIKTGQCERVIAGAVEAPITPLTIAGFLQMGALAKTGAYPFDKNREGLVLGEGGAIFVLESAKLAYERGAKVYSEILGFGLTADAYHTNTPDPEAKSAVIAIKKCLEQSQISCLDIDYIHAHGTGTILNDQMESFFIQKLFPKTVAVSSTKGATGHTLGASGALGVAFSLMALQQQILPSCVGLTLPDFDLNFVKQAQESNIYRVLCLSFGFGGQNAVIALGNIL